ncbi:enoyl-CoA hydratase/isomerase family protein [Reichenbachiella ulvae]|uniref:Enoyl-CoA hydratase/isomerase family protein n=1 Tax=Reichenbachiella ulvae TaxID=2980104 RepID=A0ABT3CTH3_9BACT|nr:enoyl-CoA hydratase/isomerase family protein [Reichenbachiella ulvae]MCV9386775.1 enoyl-CoA hydratase/isomerase family protein [Reichenbachiella ulvae]
MNGKIETSIANEIATISFSHPKGNSLPALLLTDLAEEITKQGNNEKIKCIILKSEGSGPFCAGASFDELLNLQDEKSSIDFFGGFAGVILAMKNCPKFIIVLVQGKTVGGGVGIAASADYCIATEDASIKLSELAIGIGPFVIEPAVKRKMGLAALTSLTLSPTEWKNAKWAMNHGLFQEVTSSLEEMEERASNKAEEYCNYSQEATKSIKNMLWEDTQHWSTLLGDRAKISGKLALSDTTQEALEKFRNRS